MNKTQGKGQALKTAFTYVLNQNKYDGVITVDADGQHVIADTIQVAAALDEHPHELILGCRAFDENVPFRSKFGNSLTRKIFRVVSGVSVSDTQTGLRGIPAEYLPAFLTIEGKRYEYEMSMLLYAAKQKITITEVPIKTVYLDNNSESHFNPLKDSIKIYGVIFGHIIKFVGSSLLAFGIDFILLLLFKQITGGLTAETSLLISVVSARVISSFCNYLINRKYVFEKGSKTSVLKYYLVAALILGLNYGLMWIFNIALPLKTWLAKIITECLIYPLSYILQKKFVFKA